MVRHASIRLITIVAPVRRDTKEGTARQVSFLKMALSRSTSNKMPGTKPDTPSVHAQEQ